MKTETKTNKIYSGLFMAVCLTSLLFLFACNKDDDGIKTPVAQLKVTSVTQKALYAGDKLEISGKGFGKDNTKLKVKLGAIAVKPGNITVTDNKITIKVVPVGSGFPIKIALNGRSRTFSKKGAFKNLDFKEFMASSATKTGNKLEISGKGFGMDKTKIKIKLGSKTVAQGSISLTANKITINKVPSGSGFPIKIVVGKKSQTYDNKKGAFKGIAF